MAKGPNANRNKSASCGSRLTCLDRWVIGWMLFTGFIHIIVEGQFVYMHQQMQDVKCPGLFWTTSPSEYADPTAVTPWERFSTGYYNFWRCGWLEYAKGDSRYATADTFIVNVEFITALIDGPLAILVAIAIMKNKPWRFPLQIIVSLMQFYGCTLYFTTEFYDGMAHVDMSDPLYSIGYFASMNIVWMIIPGSLIIQGFRRCVAALSAEKPKSN